MLRRLPVPAASRRTHLLLAAGLWSTVGLALLAAGTVWIRRMHGRGAIALILLAAAAGWAKAHFLLHRTAERVRSRIEERGDGRCIGGFLSWRSWLLVAGMVIAGRLLRASPLPVPWRGAVYFAIGTALFLASLRLWAYRARRGANPTA